MKLYAPTYYKDFHCIAGECRHSCCIGWEIDVDKETLPVFLSKPDIASHIETKVSEDEVPHIRLLEGERCPFLNKEGLCDMIIAHGEDILCQICRDHPRFRSYWSDGVEIGLGMVCEEAARLILSQTEPLDIQEIGEIPGEEKEISEEEDYLLDVRDILLAEVAEDEEGPMARLHEYLIYRHLSNALYDDRLEERIAFINDTMKTIYSQWLKTDQSIASLVEICRVWSYDTEYDEEELERQISSKESEI